MEISENAEFTLELGQEIVTVPHHLEPLLVSLLDLHETILVLGCIFEKGHHLRPRDVASCAPRLPTRSEGSSRKAKIRREDSVHRLHPASTPCTIVFPAFEILGWLVAAKV
jgi:hypothetical protein